MTCSLDSISCNDSIKHAAELMAKDDIGALPVYADGKDNLVGMLTDRDITIRATAKGLDPNSTKVKDIMTPHVHKIPEDHNIEEASQMMCDKKIRRVIVMDKENKKCIGIVALADIANYSKDEKMALMALKGVSCC